MDVRLRRLVFAMFIFSLVAWAAEDPLLGTWKLSLGKSKWNPPPGPQRQTAKYERFAEDGVFVTFEGVNAEGHDTFTQYAGTYDGREYPVPSSRTGVTLRLKRLDAHATERTDYKAGKPLITSRRVVSKDGKTLTVTQTGTSENGQRVNNVVVYEKQEEPLRKK